MTFLCLFVVLTALFITVLNSRTTHHLSVNEKVLNQISSQSSSSDVSKNGKSNKHISEDKIHSAIPTFS